MKRTIRGKLVAKLEGQYSNYVFQNLGVPETDELRYIMVTKCPNWQDNTSMAIGTVGFITFDYVEAGEEYIEKSTGEKKKYNYSAYYYMSFLKDLTKDTQKGYTI